MTTVSIDEAQTKLAELIDSLHEGDEIIITRDDRRVAKLVGQQESKRAPRVPGSAKGKLVIHSEDDEHLEDFKEYMP